MKLAMILEIEAGETTCASEPGKFCHFIGATRLGLSAVCTLFRDEEGHILQLFDKDGWVQRCPQCLEAFRDRRTDQ